jgi:hypothetical protein
MTAILIIIFVLSLFLIPLLVQLPIEYKDKIKKQNADNKYYDDCQKSLSKMSEKTEFDKALKNGYAAMMHISSPYHKYDVEYIKEGPLEYCQPKNCNCRWCVESRKK